jgi:hypothetical protein
MHLCRSTHPENMFCAIDIQGFSNLWGPQHLTPKEVAVKLSNGETHHFIVRPGVAFPFLNERQRRIVHWNVVNHHALGYSTGNIDERDLEAELLKIVTPCTLVLTKGRQKRLYLEEVLGRLVLDSGDLGCPPIKTATSDNCLGHFKQGARCAVAGAEFIFDWYNGDYGGAGVPEPPAQLSTEPLPCSSVCGQQDPAELEETSGSDCKLG